jgi:hypothetical protein
MYQIWKTKTFIQRRFDGRIIPDTEYELIPEQLRDIAFDRIVSLERDIQMEMDRTLTQQSLKEEVKLPVYASVWQLILIYRELLTSISLQLSLDLMGSSPGKDSCVSLETIFALS